jgi:hypothetical protein
MTTQYGAGQGVPLATSNRSAILQAGLAAGLALAFTRTADPTTASKRTKRLKTKRCKKQVQQCIDSLTTACQGDAGCLENLVCCDLFADCNAEAAVTCVFANSN